MSKFDTKLVPEAPITPIQELARMNEATMTTMVEKYKGYPGEYESIMMSLKSISVQMNKIRTKEITGDSDEA